MVPFKQEDFLFDIDLIMFYVKMRNKVNYSVKEVATSFIFQCSLDCYSAENRLQVVPNRKV